MRTATTIISALCLLLISGCGNSVRRSYVDNIEPEGWSEVASVSVECGQREMVFDLSLFVVYNPRVVSDEIPLRVVTESPSGERVGEAMTLRVDSGRAESIMMGRKSIEHFKYRSGVEWSQQGEYKIYIYPLTTVVGVYAVGVRIDQKEL